MRTIYDYTYIVLLCENGSIAKKKKRARESKAHVFNKCKLISQQQQQKRLWQLLWLDEQVYVICECMRERYQNLYVVH